jgi:hypothetical protein
MGREMLRYDRIRQQEALTEQMVNEGRSSDRSAIPMRAILAEARLEQIGRRDHLKALIHHGPQKVKVA